MAAAFGDGSASLRSAGGVGGRWSGCPPDATTAAAEGPRSPPLAGFGKNPWLATRGRAAGRRGPCWGTSPSPGTPACHLDGAVNVHDTCGGGLRGRGSRPARVPKEEAGSRARTCFQSGPAWSRQGRVSADSSVQAIGIVISGFREKARTVMSE